MEDSFEQQEQLFEQAEDLTNKQDYKKALEIIQEILKKDESHIDALNLQAKCLQAINPKDSLAVIQSYKKALKFEPNDTFTLFNLSLFYIQKENWKQALKFLQQAETIEPNNQKIQYNMALCYDALGEYEKSIRIYKVVIEKQPENHKAMVNLGIALNKTNNSQEAKQILKKAAAQHPEDSKILLNLGVTQKILGNNQKAMELYQKVITKEPDHPIACFNYAVSLNQEGNFEQAEQLFKKTMQIKPSDQVKIGLLANLQSQGKKQEALNFIKDEIKKVQGPIQNTLLKSIQQIKNDVKIDLSSKFEKTQQEIKKKIQETKQKAQEQKEAQQELETNNQKEIAKQKQAEQDLKEQAQKQEIQAQQQLKEQEQKNKEEQKLVKEEEEIKEKEQEFENYEKEEDFEDEYSYDEKQDFETPDYEGENQVQQKNQQEQQNQSNQEKQQSQESQPEIQKDPKEILQQLLLSLSNKSQEQIIQLMQQNQGMFKEFLELIYNKFLETEKAKDEKQIQDISTLVLQILDQMQQSINKEIILVCSKLSLDLIKFLANKHINDQLLLLIQAILKQHIKLKQQVQSYIFDILEQTKKLEIQNEELQENLNGISSKLIEFLQQKEQKEAFQQILGMILKEIRQSKVQYISLLMLERIIQTSSSIEEIIQLEPDFVKNMYEVLKQETQSLIQKVIAKIVYTVIQADKQIFVQTMEQLQDYQQLTIYQKLQEMITNQELKNVKTEIQYIFNHFEDYFKSKQQEQIEKPPSETGDQKEEEYEEEEFEIEKDQNVAKDVQQQEIMQDNTKEETEKDQQKEEEQKKPQEEKVQEQSTKNEVQIKINDQDQNQVKQQTETEDQKQEQQVIYDSQSEALRGQRTIGTEELETKPTDISYTNTYSVEEIRKLANENPNDAHINMKAAQILFEQGHYEESEQFYLKVRQIDQHYNEIEVVKKLGDIVFKQYKNYEKALKLYTSVAQNSELLLRQGKCYEKMRDFNKAQQLYLKATEMDQNNAQAFLRLG